MYKEPTLKEWLDAIAQRIKEINGDIDPTAPVIKDLLNAVCIQNSKIFNDITKIVTSNDEIAAQMSNNTDEEEPSWYTLSAYDEDDEEEKSTNYVYVNGTTITLPPGFTISPEALVKSKEISSYNPWIQGVGICPPTTESCPIEKAKPLVKCDHDWVEIGIVKSIICCKFCGIDKE